MDVGFDACDGHLVDVFLHLDVVTVFLSLRDVGDVILGPRLVAGHTQGQPVRGIDVHTDIPRLGQFGFQVGIALIAARTDDGTAKKIVERRRAERLTVVGPEHHKVIPWVHAYAELGRKTHVAGRSEILFVGIHPVIGVLKVSLAPPVVVTNAGYDGQLAVQNRYFILEIATQVQLLAALLSIAGRSEVVGLRIEFSPRASNPDRKQMHVAKGKRVALIPRNGPHLGRGFGRFDRLAGIVIIGLGEVAPNGETAVHYAKILMQSGTDALMLIAVQVEVFDVPSTCIFKRGHFSVYGEIRGFVETVIQSQRPVVVLHLLSCTVEFVPV